MKYLDWNDEKNMLLKRERGVSFEQVELAIASGDLFGDHEDAELPKYFGKQIFAWRSSATH
jgi:uncharacterized DUF497 family protein